MSAVPDPATPDFLDRYRNGSFTGVLRWHQLDAFWSVLRAAAGQGWYIYAVGEAVPERTAEADELLRFLDEIDALLRREHHEDYCGIVYADDLRAPTLVKIFDPNHLGSSCGSSAHPHPPGWVLSLLPPADLAGAQPLPNNRKRWWRRLFGA